MDTNAANKVKEFFSRSKPRHYTKGQVLLLNGDPVRDIYYIVEGRVKMYDVSYRGDEIILNVFKPGAFFPINLIIGDSKRSAYIYETETDVVIHQAAAGDALLFLQSNPEVALDLLKRLYSGLDGILGRMVFLMSGSAKNRLIYELLIESKRFGIVNDEGLFELSVTEKDLGARSGLSRETVSREMHKLKDAGLVTVNPRGITVHDLLVLEQLLGHGI